MSTYDHKAVEAKWQQFWEDNESFKAVRRPGKEKKYVLDMVSIYWPAPPAAAHLCLVGPSFISKCVGHCF